MVIHIFWIFGRGTQVGAWEIFEVKELHLGIIWGEEVSGLAKII
jgi:hypothetical protein